MPPAFKLHYANCIAVFPMNFFVSSGNLYVYFIMTAWCIMVLLMATVFDVALDSRDLSKRAGVDLHH